MSKDDKIKTAKDAMWLVWSTLPPSTRGKFNFPVVSGGYVRDMLVGEGSKDIDVLLFGDVLASDSFGEFWWSEWVEALKGEGWDVRLYSTYLPPDGTQLIPNRFAKAYYFVLKLSRDGYLPIDILVCRKSIDETIKEFDCNLNQFYIDFGGEVVFNGEKHPKDGLVFIDTSRLDRVFRMREFWKKYYQQSALEAQ